MKKLALIINGLLFIAFNAMAQTDTSDCSFWHPQPPNYAAHQALEVESLVPMFFTGGYHFALGYRYDKFRFRASIINGGSYNAETAGLDRSSDEFERHYKTSPGFFLGYNVWENLELYTYLEFHTFEIEQKSTGIKKDIKSTDCGAGISYQLFIGRYFYVQPGLHIYLRSDKHLDFNQSQYNIPNIDLSPVLRIGIRYWTKF